ncbi:MAG TPA: aminotransferase class IV [Holophagaceae bacterium]|nr:aminotransferase class IV [Holophagaceae bacterium]
MAPRSAARVESGEIRHASAHLERLAHSAEAQGRPAPWLPAQAEALETWVRSQAPTGTRALRLQVREDRLLARLEEMPATPDPYHLQPRLHPLGSPAAEPLAPHKGLTGAWGAAALAEVRAAGFSDALLHWPDGVLVETGIASIALETHGELWIPPVEGRVASLAERLDLPPWAASRGLLPVIRPFVSRDLEAGRLWCFNALRGFWAASVP